MSIDRGTASNVVELNRSLKDKEVEIELLQKTFTDIGSELDLDKVFEIVSARARKLIDAETLLIPLLDQNGETYTYRGGSGKNTDEIIGESLPLNFGVCGWVWQHKKPWWQGVIDELGEDDRVRWKEDVGTTILVPLQGRKQFLGGIAGINKIGGGEFDKRDLNLLQLFASIVSIAIENAMAVHQMEESNKLNDIYRKSLETLNKQMVESSRELEQLTLYDTTTKLPNRSLFHDRLSRRIDMAVLKNGNIALLLVDINHFKDINEMFGHGMGDQVLQKVADRFNKVVGSIETVARFGVDEFAIILPDHDRSSALLRAEAIRELIEAPFHINDNTLSVTASIGIVLFPEHGKDIEHLLTHVSTALSTAKKENIGLRVYDPENDIDARSQLTLLDEIHSAVTNQQFELHYQPKVSISSEKIISAEALGRWQTKSKKIVTPNVFIKIMEENDWIDEYTYWVIETTLAQTKQWRSIVSDFKVAVNISPKTLMNPGFVDSLKKIVTDRNDGQHLIFEITENLFLSEYERLSDTLDVICLLGITLSIDDYGTGYSSLSRLRRLPVSEIKIDRSFIKDMAIDRDDEAIVHSTINLAHNLGLSVVAEGVETKEALAILKNLGCDIVQGYYFSKALPVDDFEALLNKQ